jgi:mannose-6-phosphate isomerase-like protein (cupin superfamily)
VQHQPVIETRQLPEKLDGVAPDGSEIRLLTSVNGASMVHCSLASRSVSKAVSHRTVEELWYFISGQGEVWRKLGEVDEVVEVHSGTSLNIPTGTSFQFRNTSAEPLCFIIATIPPWPGEHEAVPQAGRWEDSV